MHFGYQWSVILMTGMAGVTRWNGWIPEYLKLFIPRLATGELYKYEIKAQGGLTYLKADPYANAAQLRPDTASIVADLRDYRWSDEEWIEKREILQSPDQPLIRCTKCIWDHGAGRRKREKNFTVTGSWRLRWQNM